MVEMAGQSISDEHYDSDSVRNDLETTSSTHLITEGTEGEDEREIGRAHV